MNYWLFKSEPNIYSFDMLKAEGKKGTEWTGVRNYAARNHMKAMRIGDLGFFYHSNEGKEIVGIVEVIKEAHPDPTAQAGEPWVVVDIKAVKPLKTPVTLAATWRISPTSRCQRSRSTMARWAMAS